MTRRIAGVLALALWWLVLLALFCEIPLRAPWQAAHRFPLPGSAFIEKLGRSYSADNELSLDAPGAGFATLQVRRTAVLPAADWPILHYRFSGLPRTLELAFVFRRADSSGDVQTVSLPWPPDGAGSFDLRRVPEWKGDIVEFGFSEFPTAQLVPPEHAFHAFSLDRVALESPSWRGAFAVKRCDWFGYWPWALRSVNALGPDAAAPRGRSFTLLLALGGAGSIALLTWVFGWHRRRLMLGWLAGILALWLALDLRWLANLHSRHAATRALYAGKPWSERAGLVADSELLAAADRARQALTGAPRGARVLVDADSDYDRARLAWHLAPLNTGPVNVTGYGIAAQRQDAYLVAYDLAENLHYDAARHELSTLSGEKLAAELLLDAAPLRVFRFTAGGTP